MISFMGFGSPPRAALPDRGAASGLRSCVPAGDAGIATRVCTCDIVSRPKENLTPLGPNHKTHAWRIEKRDASRTKDKEIPRPERPRRTATRPLGILPAQARAEAISLRRRSIETVSRGQAIWKQSTCQRGGRSIPCRGVDVPMALARNGLGTLATLRIEWTRIWPRRSAQIGCRHWRSFEQHARMFCCGERWALAHRFLRGPDGSLDAGVGER